MDNKNVGIISFVLLMIFVYSFFYLPRETFKYNDSKYSPINVIVETKEIEGKYVVNHKENEIIFPIGYEGQQNYNVFLPSNLISENIENIKKAGFISDKDNKCFLFFTFRELDENKFVIREVKMIPDFNHPGKTYIVEIIKIKKITNIEENLFICKILLGISICIMLIVTVFFYPDIRLD